MGLSSKEFIELFVKLTSRIIQFFFFTAYPHMHLTAKNKVVLFHNEFPTRKVLLNQEVLKDRVDLTQHIYRSPLAVMSQMR
jgi:hypothetical protein